jgi:hypothetical protein
MGCRIPKITVGSRHSGGLRSLSLNRCVFVVINILMDLIVPLRLTCWPTKWIVEFGLLNLFGPFGRYLYRIALLLV